MHPIRGIIFTVLAMVLFALSDLCIKLLVPHMPVSMVVGITGSLSGLGLLLITIYNDEPVWTRDLLRPAIVLRTVGEIFGSIMFTLALALTPISSASAIQQALPLVVTLGAVLFLGETVGWRRWLAMAVGFFGVILVIKPGTEAFDPLSIFATLSVIGFGLRDLMTPRIPKSIPTSTIAGYAFGLLGVTGFIMAIAQSELSIPPAKTWSILITMTVMVLAAVWTLTTALRIAPVSVVIPFRYTRIVFAMIIGVFFLGETPDIWTYFGSALIVVAGLYSIWREAKLARALPFGQTSR